MPLPLIIGGVVLLVTGGAGGTAGVKGIVNFKEASGIARDSKKDYDRAVERHAGHYAMAREQIVHYGARQREVQGSTLMAWIQWLTENNQSAHLLERDSVAALSVSLLDQPTPQKLVHEGKLLEGGVKAVVGAFAAQQLALGGVSALAVAGTGTAISTLSGAAAESATLAWLGGGALAAGGGGIAAGGMMLTGIGAVPALLIGGITLAIQGEQAKTRAHEYSAAVETAVAEMDLQVKLLLRVRRTCIQLRAVLDQLDARAVRALSDLNAVDFDADQDLELARKTALLMAALGAVLSTPLLGEDGDISDEIGIIIEGNRA